MQWLDHPRQSPEPDSEFVLPAGLHLVGQAVVQGDAVLFAAAHTQGAVTEEARLYRWVPSADRIDPASRPPLVQPPTALDLGPCAPFTPGFLTDDAGGWSESAKADPDLSGAVRQTGPGGAFIQAYPGTQPALPPTARLDATSYGATQLYLSPIPDGYLARAVLDAPKQPAPCNTLNLIGHHVTREELLQQLGSLATLVFSGPGPRGHM
jgi:hypothetical protein